LRGLVQRLPAARGHQPLQLPALRRRHHDCTCVSTRPTQRHAEVRVDTKAKRQRERVGITASYVSLLDFVSSRLDEAILIRLKMSTPYSERYLRMDRWIVYLEDDQGSGYEPVQISEEALHPLEALQIALPGRQAEVTDVFGNYYPYIPYQKEIIYLEVVKAQKEQYEDRFRNPEYVETYEELEHSYATESTYIFWPFTGEFWQDELGYYRFTEHGSCQARASSQ